MKRVAIALMLTAGCARPHHPSPYVPPETQHSAGSTLLAAGGVVAASVGAQVAQRPGASARSQTAGTAAMGAGVGMIAASLIDAIEVQKEREKFIKLTRAFYHHYYGYDPIEPKEPAAPPPLPEVPFNFKDPSDDPEEP
jgi:hypothetical protein